MDNITRRISLTIQDVIEKSTPITHCLSRTNYYYLCDIYEQYKSIMDISINDFLTSLSHIETVVVKRNNDNISMCLVCLKEKHNEAIAQSILNIPKTTKSTSCNDICSVSELSEGEIVSHVVTTSNKNIGGKNNAKRHAQQNYHMKRIKNEFGNKSASHIQSDFKSISRMLISSFQSGVLIPTSSLNLAVAETHGMAFNYKQSVCKIGRHPHGTLSKYISCCDDIFELLRLKNSYIKRIDYASKIITENRKNAHFRNLNGPNYKFHLEMLIVNIFPVKATIPFSDLLDIFKHVYGVGIESICTQQPMTLLSAIESPNLYFTRINELMITLVPLCSSEYKYFGDEKTMLKVHEIELNIKTGKKDKDSDSRPTTPQYIAPKPVIEFGVSGKEEFVVIASHNIPRSIQNIRIELGPLAIFKHYEVNDLLNVEWINIMQSVKVDNKPTFFLAK